MLVARNLRKSFGEVQATDDVTVAFGRDPGEMVFVVGPNGAGKTTLVNLLTGRLAPDAGQVLLVDDADVEWDALEGDGSDATRPWDAGAERDITDLTPERRVHAGVVRSFQVVKLFEEMTARENLRTAVLSERGLLSSATGLRDGYPEVEAAVEDLLERFRLGDRADDVAEELPHGDRKLLDVAMSFALDPEYLLLDEPTSGVSTGETELVIETIADVSREEGVTTITIEHDMDIVSGYADRVVALHQGRVHGRGPPEMLETDDELRRLLLGVET
ncbi:ABC transporter ATP-binding protein [Halobacteriales archaeon QS_1_68_20]|nr:MAG: ABC transporter ATP-binding protein [Halobacteriales archaeon QS_1_68_20]